MTPLPIVLWYDSTTAVVNQGLIVTLLQGCSLTKAIDMPQGTPDIA